MLDRRIRFSLYVCILMASFFFCSVSIYSQNKANESVLTKNDSAIINRYLSKNPEDTTTVGLYKKARKTNSAALILFSDKHPEYIKSLCQLASVLHKMKEYRQTYDYFSNAYFLSTDSIGLKHKSIMQYYERMLISFAEFNDNIKIRNLLPLTIEYYNLKENNKKSLAYFYNKIANTEFDFKHYDDSFHYLTKTDSILNSEKKIYGWKTLWMNNCDLISKYYIIKKDYNSALTFIENMEKSTTEADTTVYFYVKSRKAESLSELGKQKPALNIYNNLRKFCLNRFGPYDGRTAYVLRSIGKIYYDQGKLDLAYNMFSESLAIVNRYNGLFGTQKYLYDSLGEICIMRDEYDEALEYLLHSKRIQEETTGKASQDTMEKIKLCIEKK